MGRARGGGGKERKGRREIEPHEYFRSYYKSKNECFGNGGGGRGGSTW